VKKDEKLT